MVFSTDYSLSSYTLPVIDNTISVSNAEGKAVTGVSILADQALTNHHKNSFFFRSLKTPTTLPTALKFGSSVIQIGIRFISPIS